MGTTINTVLPQSGGDMDVATLVQWFSNSGALRRYLQTEDYPTLVSRGIRRAGARPFLFVDGACSPYCQRANCWNNGGTPKYSNGRGSFQWWSVLINGYLSLALDADPDIDMVHLWNEPDSVSLVSSPSVELLS